VRTLPVINCGLNGFMYDVECRWLDIKEDDGLTVREITADGSQMLSSKEVTLTLEYTPRDLLFYRYAACLGNTIRN
jgi:hypothetical protein